jgi:hypothetical protein
MGGSAERLVPRPRFALTPGRKSVRPFLWYKDARRGSN